MTPKEEAIKLFNSIKNTKSEDGKDCIICDCVTIPLAKLVCDMFIEDRKCDGRLQSVEYWQEVKEELTKI